MTKIAGRPRSPGIDEAAFRAALSIVETEGYDRLTMERVAATSGVAKTSLYRRFRSRSELAAEALLSAYPIQPESGEQASGAVRRHLERIFRAVSGAAGPVLQGMMADAQLDPHFRTTFRDRFIHARREALAAAIRLEHGEVSDIALALDVALGIMWYRLLVGHAVLDDAAAETLAELICQTLQAE